MMTTNEIKEETPGNIEELIRAAGDKTSYKKRLDAVKELSKWKCQQSKDVLWRLMMNDLVFPVQEQAFRALQKHGQDVKLPKSKKGKTIKNIEQKIAKIKKLIGDDFTIEKYKERFLQEEPEAYDVYMFEKGVNFDKWILNTIQTLPKNKDNNWVSGRVKRGRFS